MAELYKALAAADLAVLTPPPSMIMAPISGMMTSAEAPSDTLIYTVPVGFQAIIKLIILTSSDDGSERITLRCYSELGPIPLFGPVLLGPGEWAEWSGSLTLGSGSEIRGAVPSGEASASIYGMERTL